MERGPQLVQKTTNEAFDILDVTLIGRKKSCQILIEESQVSRQHAMIRKQGQDFMLYDLGSSNGTFVNNQRVILPYELQAGDHVVFWQTEFVFQPGEKPGEEDDDGEEYDQTISEIRTIPVILLVSDIKEFTKISENLEPDDLAQTIGVWYRDCTQVLGSHGATIDKFIGDAVLAYWTDISPESREQALQAARDLQASCRRIYQENEDSFQSKGLHLGAGTGLHRGKVAHGAMGEGTFTLLGDAVNATFRLESLTRTVGKDVLVSEEFLGGWDDGRKYCQHEGSHKVKGRTTAIEVYSVESFPAGS